MPAAEDFIALLKDNVKNPYLDACIAAGIVFDASGNINANYEYVESDKMIETYPSFLKVLNVLYSPLSPLFMKMNIFINPNVLDKNKTEPITAFISLNEELTAYSVKLTDLKSNKTKEKLRDVGFAHYNLESTLSINKGCLLGVVRTPPTDLQAYISVDMTLPLLKAEYGL